MPLTISDDMLKEAGLTEREALIEFACRLFDAEKLTKFQASKLLGMSRDEFEGELLERGLPLFRYTEEAFRQDLAAVKEFQAERLREAAKR